MASEVSICNLALTNIGKDNIQALDDAGAEAKACRQFYAHVRDLVLQEYPWRFARKTQSLAQVTNTKPGAWKYAYVLPNDCLKPLWVRAAFDVNEPSCVADDIANPFDIEGDKFYCNVAPAFLSYTFRLTDPTKFKPLFVEALSWHLSVRLAMPLTRDPKVRADAYQLALRTSGAAQTADANEVRETSDHESDLVKARS